MSGRLRIVLQIVRLTIFVFKYINDIRWRQPTTNLIHFNY